ncbi:MAG: 50S ribosomal protein L16, partial [Patescibacteria group bacterium]
MLLPKKVKYRKMMKGRIHGTAGQKISLSFGEFGLKSLDSCWVTSRQIEAARRAIMHFLKRGGKLWIRIFPDKPITTKGAEVPMGGCKGSVDHYVAAVKKGMVLFELT